jgi:membrane protease YdiL (CAAX protease family)
MALLVIGIPLWGNFVTAPALRKRVPAGTLDRPRFYLRGMLLLWTCAALVVADWVVTQRPLAVLGLTMPAGTGFLIGLLLTGVIIGMLIGATVKFLRAGTDKTRKWAEKNPLVFGLLPANRREFIYFVCLSITAGLTEELLYRGFLIYAFGAYVNIPVAAVLSSAFFGLGHGYQGISGMMKTTLLGLVMALLYLGSGTLLLPMVLHACLDIQGGTIGFQLKSARVK